jgi:hypothetical protein
MKPRSKYAAVLALCVASCAMELLAGCAEQRQMLTGETSSGTPRPIECRLHLATCVPIVIPPRVAEMADYSAVALAPDASPASGIISTQLEGSMSKVRVNDRPFYTILPPDDPARQVRFEIAASVGKLSETHGTEPRSVCNDPNPPLGLCKNSSLRQVACTERELPVGITIRVRAANGKLIATRTEGGTGKSKLCLGDTGVLLEHDALAEAAANQAVTAIIQDLVVRTEIVQVLSRDAAPEITDTDRQQRFKEAVAFLKAGRLDRSCPVFQELSEIEGSSVAVLYNMAFCTQTKGDWCGANALYRRADAQTHAPDSDLANRITETQQSCLAEKRTG